MASTRKFPGSPYGSVSAHAVSNSSSYGNPAVVYAEIDVSAHPVSPYGRPTLNGPFYSESVTLNRDQLLEDFYGPDESEPDVPDHVNETVNPYEPWTDAWFDWYGGTIPKGLFGPGAASCDRVRIYLDALQFCCETSAACSPFTTRVDYVFIDADCNVLDAQCMMMSDGVVGAPDWMPPSTSSVWDDFVEWVSDEWDDDVYTEQDWENESGYDDDVDNDFDDDGELEPCRMGGRTGMRCETSDGRPGYIYVLDKPYPCIPDSFCDPDPLHDVPGIDVVGP